MHDDFLYKNRPPVREAFSKNLYQRLSRLESESLDLQKGKTMRRSLNRKNLTWEYALFTLVIATALILTISEPVRAKAWEWFRTIAGINVEEQSESPLTEIEEKDVEIYAVPTFALPAALENPPFQFDLPTWIPEGYVLDQNVAIAQSGSLVLLAWNGSNLSEIQMLVEREYTGYTIPTGTDSVEEVNVKGLPAILIVGSWNEQHQWDPSLGITLGWEEDGHFYRLIYAERESAHNTVKPIDTDRDTIIDQLIRMAESVQ